MMKYSGTEISGEVLTRFEFHRQATALMPDQEDRDPGVAVMVNNEETGLEFLNCNCAKSKKTACPHIKKLAEVNRFYQLILGDTSLVQRVFSGPLAGCQAAGAQWNAQHARKIRGRL